MYVNIVVGKILLYTVKNVVEFIVCLLFNVVWKLKTRFGKKKFYISHWKLSNSMLNYIYTYCNFVICNIDFACNMILQWIQMDIQQIKLSFIYIRILISHFFSLFLISEIFNIIDHKRILNFIICICIKLHIHLY